MKRFMTCWMGDTDEILAFTEDENWKEAQENADDFVWQWATSREVAVEAHHDKLEECQRDPTKETY